MTWTRTRCPVCHNDVTPTIKGNIAAHFDRLRIDKCPAGGEPFHIGVPYGPEFVGVES